MARVRLATAENVEEALVMVRRSRRVAVVVEFIMVLALCAFLFLQGRERSTSEFVERYWYTYLQMNIYYL